MWVCIGIGLVWVSGLVLALALCWAADEGDHRLREGERGERCSNNRRGKRATG